MLPSCSASRCLATCDELRRLRTTRDGVEPGTLWALARRADREGRIAAGADPRGGTRRFIRALGGLAALGKPPRNAVRRSMGRLTDAAGGCCEWLWRSYRTDQGYWSSGRARAKAGHGWFAGMQADRGITVKSFALALAKARFAEIMHTESTT